MIWYLCNIFIIILIWSQCNIEYKEKPEQFNRQIKYFFLLETVVWIILSGLRRIDIGEDTSTYKYMFLREKSVTWGQVMNEFIQKYIFSMNIIDPGYKAFEKTIHFFTDNYQIYLIILAIIIFSTLANFIYKNSHNAFISYMLFCSLFYSFYAFTGLRQTLATAMCVFLGTDFIKKREIFKFFLCIIVASTIHMSVLCFFPFYWLSQIKINRISLSIYWILIIISYSFRSLFLKLLQRIIGYEQYTDFSAQTSPITFLGLLFFICIFCSLFYSEILIKRKKIKFKNKKKVIILENKEGVMAINALFIAAIFSSLVLINPSCMRVVNYYSLFLMILLPECGNVIVKKQQKLFEGICFLILLLLLIRNKPIYYFFWQ